MNKLDCATSGEKTIQIFNAPLLAEWIAGNLHLLTKWACSALNASSRFWFLFMWSFVGVVSGYDAYLGVRFWDSMPDMERNPICLYLIQQTNGNPIVFLAFKAAGTLLVLTAMAALYLCSPRLAQRIACGVASFQFGLLLYLTLA